MESPDPLEPASFCPGLVAELYAPLRSVAADAAPYARFIERSGEPALELGCGDGDPLLELRAQGLDFEGLDSPADMSARCRTAAQARGLEVALHHQSIELMQLARRYRAIFLAGSTFNLPGDDDAVRAALAAIREHLDPAGSVLIPLIIPESTPARALGVAREKTRRRWFDDSLYAAQPATR